MTTKTATASFEGPRRSYFLPMCEEEMINDRQRHTLTELIFQNIDEDKRDSYLNQISELTSSEASEMIMEFTMAKW
ncbi:hypothetical protein EXS45_02350 [Candidatus Nomurabacteria bacterium]|nr:hypothetical protein [Candidatus Nomurabacteria bacterium]